MKIMKAVDKIVLSIAMEFSKTPGPRYKDEGDHSGEIFRQTILLPKIKKAMGKGIILLVDMDGTAGFGTSFLEEAFGGLIRVDALSYDDICKVLELKSDEEEYLKEDVHEYMRDAQDEKHSS